MEQIYFGAAITGIFIVVAILRTYTASAPANVVPTHRMGPSKAGPSLMLVVAGLVVVRALVGVNSEGFDDVRLALLLSALVITLLFAPLLTRAHVVIRRKAISGPAKAYGPFLGIKRNTLRIADIAKMGKTRWGYSYFETKTSDRIYFDEKYKGWNGFQVILRRAQSALDNPQPQRFTAASQA